MYHAVALLLSHDELICAGLAHAAEVEPRLELCQALEHVRQQEVEQAPQLAEVVLQGSACSHHALSNSVLLLRQHLTISPDSPKI